ncbi:hypothetical protein DRO47_05570 [Candidatus Bathyarchaeota archaeon]|nr:hypothetical protein [Candidatus Bathyarchaeota archaeon]PDM26592.1 MAG: hypothetical protein CP083_03085 [Candidatus Bathyarchaeota archaeon B24-2]RLI19973.1 MAG: hypothetical protein DRO47_05570 [Candidatus Bathyarchaeota archaeon]
MSTKTWKVIPLHTMVLDALNRKKSLTDVDLLDFLRSRDDSVTINDLNRALMKLELNGLIVVESLTRGKRRVELRETRIS